MAAAKTFQLQYQLRNGPFRAIKDYITFNQMLTLSHVTWDTVKCTRPLKALTTQFRGTTMYLSFTVKLGQVALTSAAAVSAMYGAC